MNCLTKIANAIERGLPEEVIVYRADDEDFANPQSIFVSRDPQKREDQINILFGSDTEISIMYSEAIRGIRRSVVEARAARERPPVSAFYIAKQILGHMRNKRS